MLSEQQIRLLNEEITNVREHLANTQKHLNDLRIALDKEVSQVKKKIYLKQNKIIKIFVYNINCCIDIMTRISVTK